VANTLAYFDTAIIIAKTSLKVQAPGKHARDVGTNTVQALGIYKLVCLAQTTIYYLVLTLKPKILLSGIFQHLSSP
jgi:hypothetical protein